jgi:hypothetical protein
MTRRCKYEIIIDRRITVKLRHSVHYIYQFPTLRCLSLHSTITSLHIFLSLCYSLLSLTSWWLSYWYCRCFVVRWESQNVWYAFSEMSYFYDLRKPPGTFGVPNRILRDTGTEIFKKPLNKDSSGKTATNGIATFGRECNFLSARKDMHLNAACMRVFVLYDHECVPWEGGVRELVYVCECVTSISMQDRQTFRVLKFQQICVHLRHVDSHTFCAGTMYGLRHYTSAR